MEPLPTGLTWKDVVARFSEDDTWAFSLSQRKRRTNRTKRAKDETEERLVWRLIVPGPINDADKPGWRSTIRRRSDCGA